MNKYYLFNVDWLQIEGIILIYIYFDIYLKKYIINGKKCRVVEFLT